MDNIEDTYVNLDVNKGNEKPCSNTNKIFFFFIFSLYLFPYSPIKNVCKSVCIFKEICNLIFKLNEHQKG